MVLCVGRGRREATGSSEFRDRDPIRPRFRVAGHEGEVIDPTRRGQRQEWPRMQFAQQKRSLTVLRQPCRSRQKMRGGSIRSTIWLPA